MNRRAALRTLLATPLSLTAALDKSGLRSAETGEGTPEVAPQVRKVYNFDFDWSFHLGDVPGAQLPGFDSSRWLSVQLPHDWGIGLPFREDVTGSGPGDFSQKGIGWYRKSFYVQPLPSAKVHLNFDGVYQNCKVWLNGQQVASRAYGYVPLQADLSPFLLPGQNNVVAVRVDNETGPKSRWYSGSGINRHTRLSIKHPVHVPDGGLRIVLKSISTAFAELELLVDIRNDDTRSHTVLARSTILAAENPTTGMVTQADRIEPGQTGTVRQAIFLRSPDFWTPETPALYHLRAELLLDNEPIDDAVTSFGIRAVNWDPEFGALLNGKTTKLRGVCLHTDCGLVGSAVPDQVFERRLRILKSLGCNAIRVAHRPAPAELLDLCDRMGFLVIEEPFDKWNLGQAPGLEHPNFEEDWQRDIDAMLVRDRNRPSVIAWSLGNEAGIPGDPAHDETIERLAKYIKGKDPTRAVTCAFLGNTEGTIADNVGAILKAGRPLDFYSLNYQERYFPLLRETNPRAMIVASEAYPFFRSVFGGVEPFNSWYVAAQNSWVPGSFVWAGFDYFGESAGWPSKGWPNGLLDTCGAPKPMASFFRTVWSAQPHVDILVVDPKEDADPGLPFWRGPGYIAHWNLIPDEIYAVHTPSNCETVELIVDGVSYGRRAVAESANQTIIWFVRHQRGKLRAIARNGDEVVAESVLKSAGEAVALKVEVDRLELRANGQDVCHVELSLVDAEGTVVPDADRQIRMGVAGPATLLGMDNGDLRDHEPFSNNSRNTRKGRCLAILQAWRVQGTALAWFDADLVPSASISFEVRAAADLYPPYPSAAPQS